MAHIALPEGAPGIIGPMLAYPETEKHLTALAEALLRGPSSLTPAEREVRALLVIASKVQQGGRNVTEEDAARLATWTPRDEGVYDRIGPRPRRLPARQTAPGARARETLNQSQGLVSAIRPVRG